MLPFLVCLIIHGKTYTCKVIVKLESENRSEQKSSAGCASVKGWLSGRTVALRKNLCQWQAA
jgi:hypothetical protein